MRCPRCGNPAVCDEVDNGVGMQQCGPYGCPECQWDESDNSPSRFAPGDRVVYRPTPNSTPEEGTVTSVNDVYVFVCYGLPGSTSRATHPLDLHLVSGKR